LETRFAGQVTTAGLCVMILGAQASPYDDALKTYKSGDFTKEISIPAARGRWQCSANGSSPTGLYPNGHASQSQDRLLAKVAARLDELRLADVDRAKIETALASRVAKITREEQSDILRHLSRRWSRAA
jgi:hypothetical protein